MSDNSLNTQFANLLSRLSDAMSKTGEPMKARAYKNAEETILGIPMEIKSLADLKGLPGIGPAITNKLQEYLDTGKIGLLEREENRPEIVLTNVYGIGPKKAKELVQNGILTIDSLRQHQDEVLNEVQKKGLAYYDDILARIPRGEIVEYDRIFRKVFGKIKSVYPKADFEIVGSYRRGAQNSGDIDVIIGSLFQEAYEEFLDELISKKIIVEVLSRGKNKCLCIAKIPKSKRFRRIDFLYANPKEYPFSVLYFTGSKGFNAVMRGHALKMGYSLNEHGFSLMEGKTKGAFIDREFSSESDIFEFLNLEYKEPPERVDGRAVIINTESNSDRKYAKEPSFESNSDRKYTPITAISIKGHSKEEVIEINEINEPTREDIKEKKRVQKKSIKEDPKKINKKVIKEDFKKGVQKKSIKENTRKINKKVINEDFKKGVQKKSIKEVQKKSIKEDPKKINKKKVKKE